MQIEIQARAKLTVDQERALDTLSRAVYPPSVTVDSAHTVQWAATQWAVLIWDEANLVSHAGVLTREGKYNDMTVLLGGIGGVKTHPQARRRGYAGVGLVKAGEFLRDECGVDFSLLVCREELLNYYERFGWQHFRGDVIVTQSSGRVPFTFNEPMVLSGSQTAPNNGVLDLCGMPW